MFFRAYQKTFVSDNPNLNDCLAGGGEMGALIRSIDWAATPLGPVASWPQSLRTSVSILLATRFPMYIAWGDSYTQLYNDGYRPILGSTKHPAAMGLSTRETFRESWHIIGPMFDEVMRGNAFGKEDWMLPLDRHGFLEECYFTFSYSPIRDESGGVGGVLVTVTETTERVLGERRLRTLRDLAAHAAEANEEEDVWHGAAEALAENDHDLPFTLFYGVEDEGRTARLLGATGLCQSTQASPATIDLTGEASLWRLGEVTSSGQAELLEDVGGDVPGGPWPEAASRAFVLPITRPGLPHPYGLLVAGLSARLSFDAAYRSFLYMAASHVGTALSNARAYKEERRRAEALAELDRAKTTFFSNVSHEFRTPLALMLGPLEDLRARAEGTLKNREAEQLALIHRNGLRLLKLVNTLLDSSRIEAGRVQAVYEPTDLAAVTTELASVFRSAIERAGLTLSVDCPPLSAPAYVDREMWEKVVLNLISNAFKFTHQGQIDVTLRETGGAAELCVRDTGAGIPADEVNRIFERFHRVEGVEGRTHEGTGIGLALVQELVRFHGGQITVESTYGEGSTFRVCMPMGRAHLPADRILARRSATSATTGAMLYVEEALRWLPEDTPAPASDAAARPAAGAFTSRARILLADDNADMRGYLRRLLAPDYDVEAVADGEAALAAARRRTPDLVLSDVMMPRIDGFELVRALRADAALAAVPVVLLSARAGEASRVEGLEQGADDYLIKPFSARELLARVRANLEMARMRREVAYREQALEDEHAFTLRLQDEVAERHKAEQALGLANRLLAERNKELQDFAYVASHDLQEPLRKISTFADLLRTDYGNVVDAQGVFYINRMKDAAMRMSRLIQDLLAFSRVATRGALFEPVDLNETIQEVLYDLEVAVREAGGAVEVEVLPTVAADPTQMRQLFQNLIGNALKFHREGVPPHVRVSKADAEDDAPHTCQIVVQDNGIGFDEQYLDLIFAPFERLQRTSKYPGSGMGLAICKRIVERHEGLLVARSTPGEGSVFLVTLPTSRPEVLESAAPTPQVTAAS